MSDSSLFLRAKHSTSPKEISKVFFGWKNNLIIFLSSLSPYFSLACTFATQIHLPLHSSSEGRCNLFKRQTLTYQ